MSKLFCDSDIYADWETPTGMVIAVLGGRGAPGRTTVSVALARQLHLCLGNGVALVDADLTAPAVDVTLGLSPDHPDALAACAVVSNGMVGCGGPDGVTVVRAPHNRNAGAVLELIERLRWAGWVVVIDTQPWGMPLSYELANKSDIVCWVARGDTVGLLRSFNGLKDLAVSNQKKFVVINQLAISDARSCGRAVRDLLAKVGITSSYVIPMDDCIPRCVMRGGRWPRRSRLVEVADCLANELL